MGLGQTFKYSLPKVNTSDIKCAEDRLGVEFPGAYRSFVLRVNGGRPKLGYFRWNDPREGSVSERIDRFRGVTAAQEDLSVDDRNGFLYVDIATQRIRSLIPDHSVAVAWTVVPGDLIVYCNGERCGQGVAKILGVLADY